MKQPHGMRRHGPLCIAKHTLVCSKTVMKQPLQDTRCRDCKKDQVRAMHLLAACLKYASTLYISRYDMALRVLYYCLRHIHIYMVKMKKKTPYIPGDIPAEVQNENVKIFWNIPFSTTAEITANKPDMVVLDNPRKTLLVMSCPLERNIQNKELEKTGKTETFYFS
ncbi:hypothetical protein QE152_g36907 [Popillia japonica]|uniref:Uncharacterized protein n=1 Tax=Popillia japonica TaxID=7064 RepID=A0AAW1IC08_POPJA